MKVSLKELRSGVCSHIDFDYTIDLSKEEVNFEFPFKKPVRFSGNISDMAGVLNLSADIEAEVTSQCARCGKPVEFNKLVVELFNCHILNISYFHELMPPLHLL